MTITDWVRLRGDDSGRRGQVITFGGLDRNGCYSVVFVRWRDGVKMHAPEELEAVDG